MKMGTSHQPLFGLAMPEIFGAFTDGRFFSTVDFIGKTGVFLLAEGVTCDLQTSWVKHFLDVEKTFAACEADFAMILPMTSEVIMAHTPSKTPKIAIAQPSADFSLFPKARSHPDVVIVDRSGYIVKVISLDDETEALEQTLETVSALQPAKSVYRNATAPILVVPHFIGQETCEALIDAFESGSAFESGMASLDKNFNPIHREDSTKKRRRDVVLEPDHPLFLQILPLISGRLAQEIFKAFQARIAHIDRVLIACYDESGGYFHRHRDNLAPHVAYRQFAMSLNLNTGAYEGGDLEFPEFGNDLYRPEAGTAVVFSASLLHAAKPVTKGRRYVLLTFLHDQAAEMARLTYENPA